MTNHFDALEETLGEEAACEDGLRPTTERVICLDSARIYKEQWKLNNRAIDTAPRPILDPVIL